MLDNWDDFKIILKKYNVKYKEIIMLKEIDLADIRLISIKTSFSCKYINYNTIRNRKSRTNTRTLFG